MKLTPARAANIGVGLIVITAIVLVSLHLSSDSKPSQQSSVRLTPTASPTHNPLSPSLPPHTARYPELNERVTKFAQLRYSRPAQQTPQQLKQLLVASGLVMSDYANSLATTMPPAYQTFDAQGINVVSQAVASTIDGEFSEKTHSQVVETYQMTTYQVLKGKKQYPAQFFKSSTWRLVNGQWLVVSTSA